MSNEQKHPREYNYLGDEQITISVSEFQMLARFAEIVLNQETKLEFTEKYHYVNRETSELVKKVTDKNKHLVEKVFDFNKTRMSEPNRSMTPLGMEALSVKYMINGVHLRNIDGGIAKHISELNPVKTETEVNVKAESTSENSVEKGE